MAEIGHSKKLDRLSKQLQRPIRALLKVLEHIFGTPDVGILRGHLDEPREMLLGTCRIAGVEPAQAEDVVRLGRLGIGLERLLRGGDRVADLAGFEQLAGLLDEVARSALRIRRRRSRI